MAEAQLPAWNSTAVRVGTPSNRSNEDAGAAPTRCYHAGNWLLLALFALALASAGLSIRLFIVNFTAPSRHRRDACSIAYPTHWLICAQVPCDKKTSYETTNTTTIVNMTSFENVTVMENVTVTETVLQLENITKYENVSSM